LTPASGQGSTKSILPTYVLWTTTSQAEGQRAYLARIGVTAESAADDLVLYFHFPADAVEDAKPRGSRGNR
jgi:hypothetical protein